jgi:hypothetical protein
MKQQAQMKIALHALVIVVAAGIGLALGFVFRGKPRSVTQSPDLVAASSDSRQSNVARASIRKRVRLNDDSPLTTRLEQDLSMSSGVTRWLYWLEALEKAQPADFPRLVRLAQGNSTAMRFVSARWIEVAPRHMFDTLVTASKHGDGFPVNDLGYQLFQEWPKRDPDAAIAALSGTNNFGLRSAWRNSAATAVFDADVERGVRVFAEWNIGNYGPRMTGVAKWAAADPRHAAQFTLDNPAGYVSQMMMETIGKEWGKTDPVRAMEFAVATPGELSAKMARSAVKQWAENNLGEATDWLTSADVATRNRLGATFVEVWAKQDPAEALAWCGENLSGTALNLAVGGVLKGVAAKDVVGAAALVAQMEPSSGRAEAALAVAQKWFPNFSSNKPATPEAIAWLAGLDGDSVKRVLDEVTWSWSTSDAKSMAAFLEGVKEKHVPQYTYSTVARELARKNPADALDWAGRLPGQTALSAGGDAFAEWRNSQPVAAMEWLDKLPTTDKRREVFFKSAIQSLAWQPQAAEQIAAMSPTERATARNVIEQMGLPNDRRERLLGALKGL